MRLCFDVGNSRLHSRVMKMVKNRHLACWRVFSVTDEVTDTRPRLSFLGIVSRCTCYAGYKKLDTRYIAKCVQFHSSVHNFYHFCIICMENSPACEHSWFCMNLWRKQVPLMEILNKASPLSSILEKETSSFHIEINR